MVSFFPLCENFRTQDEPAYCGLGTLTTVLNALAIDPGRLWKGVWRWYSEDMLHCCKPLDQVRTEGIVFDAWVCLAKCNGVQIEAKHASESSIEEFREVVKKCVSTTHEILVVSYSRKTMNQTGDGHYSPIAGYNAARDMVLIMDVARFKHPPHWVPMTAMFESMTLLDASVNSDRGYAVMCNGRCSSMVARSFMISQVEGVFANFRQYFQLSFAEEFPDVAAAELPWKLAFQMPAAVAAFVVTFEEQKDKGSASWVAHNQECDDLDSELVHDHETLQQDVTTQLLALPLCEYIATAAAEHKSEPLGVSPAAAALMILGADHLGLLSAEMKAALGDLLATEGIPEGIAADLEMMYTQLEGLAHLDSNVTALAPASDNSCCGSKAE